MSPVIISESLLLNKPNKAPPTTFDVIDIFSTSVEPQVGQVIVEFVELYPKFDKLWL